LSERLNIAISDDAPFNITYVKFVFNNTTTNQNNSGFHHNRSTRMSIGPKPKCTITIMAMSTISYLDSEGSSKYPVNHIFKQQHQRKWYKTQIPEVATVAAGRNRIREGPESAIIQNGNGFNKIIFDTNLVKICVNVYSNEYIKSSAPDEEEPATCERYFTTRLTRTTTVCIV